MSKITKIVAGMAALPVLALSAPASATANPGQIEAGDIYRAKNLTTNGAFADNITATCGDTVQFRVRIHNGGPATLTNVKVGATLDGQSSTSHGSTVTVSADNNLHGASVSANAGVSTDKNTTISYVSGSTQLLDYSATPGASNVIKNLPDGIIGSTVNIGSVGPLTSDTESVQFQVKLNCEVTPPAKIQVCELATKKLVYITEDQYDTNKYSKDLSKCAPTPPPVKIQVCELATKKIVTINESDFNATKYSKDLNKCAAVVVPGKLQVCELATKKIITINENDFDSAKHSKDLNKCAVVPPTTPVTPVTPTTLVNTGAGQVIGLFAVVAVAATAAYSWVLRRQNAR